ncbi:MAG: ABC transporter permease [Prevotellaceae bacterium]|jgi:NitT/TauT family transport system permease protein|nr:ABC transporter permease [Prevotellaceae bacterium]
MSKKKLNIRNKLYGLLLFNLIWYFVAGLVDSPVLIGPVATYVNMFNIMPSMWSHLTVSLERIVVGLLISILAGAAIGIVMARSPKVNSMLSPLVYFTYPVPKLALLPVVMLLTGIGEISKIIMIILIVIFQVIISTRDAVNNIPKDNYNVLISLGAGKMQQFREITFPAILPDLFTTLRIALGIAVSVLFFTETYGTDRGMGYYIVDAWMRINYLDMYAGIALLSIMGFLLFLLIDLADTVCCKWNKAISV